MAVGDTITIAGLTGSSTADTTELTIGGADAGKFSVGGVASKGTWTQSTGTLVLTAQTAVNSNTNIVVTFDLAEPTSSQAAVSPTIATNFAAGSLTETALTGSNILVKATALTWTSAATSTSLESGAAPGNLVFTLGITTAIAAFTFKVIVNVLVVVPVSLIVFVAA